MIEEVFVVVVAATVSFVVSAAAGASFVIVGTGDFSDELASLEFFLVEVSAEGEVNFVDNLLGVQFFEAIAEPFWLSIVSFILSS